VIYDLDTVRARNAVRLAKAELRRWERRYDRHRGDDPLRHIDRIRAAELHYNKAVEELRLVRDGRRERLPESVPDEAAPRMPAFGA